MADDPINDPTEAPDPATVYGLAQDAIDAYARLREADRVEPVLPDDADATHPKAGAWLRWREQRSEPAHAAWKAAVAALNEAAGITGDGVMHPFSVLPLAVHVLTGCPVEWHADCALPDRNDPSVLAVLPHGWR